MISFSLQVMTTPVSMSYSEWISTHSTAQRNSKASNIQMHDSSFNLQETDEKALSVYNIVYSDSNSTSHEPPSVVVNPIIIEVNKSLPLNNH